MRQLYLSLFVIAVFSISAQKMLTVSDAVLKQRSTLAPSKLQQIKLTTLKHLCETNLKLKLCFKYLNYLNLVQIV